MSNYFRFVVCVDVDAETLKEAYTILNRKMKKTELGWETDDEWFDKDGEMGDADELQKAIVESFQESEECINGTTAKSAPSKQKEKTPTEIVAVKIPKTDSGASSVGSSSVGAKDAGEI